MEDKTLEIEFEKQQPVSWVDVIQQAIDNGNYIVDSDDEEDDGEDSGEEDSDEDSEDDEEED